MVAQDKTFIGVGTSLLPPLDDENPGAQRPTIAIMSFGEMGAGIASLLTRYSYRVVTNLDGRSGRTWERAKSLNVKMIPFTKLLETASILLSIVPPSEALPLAKKVAAAYASLSMSRATPLQYVDMNAISPDLCKEIESTLTLSGLAFIDGAIIGFPPKMIDGQLWFRPSITIAGPDLVEPWTTQLKSLLNFRHVSSAVGDASGLKMCFGAIYKGHAAVFIQAYTTAYRMGVLEPLREHLAEYFPSVAIIHESSMVGSQRKAYRWIKEMEEIETTFQSHGGWGPELFAGVGDVFRIVSQTGLEKNNRETVEEIADTIGQSLLTGK
jgi:3-hydroxyisobutyrate dehydrogenase-like beta-hydroxyacid dehydrogenase